LHVRVATTAGSNSGIFSSVKALPLHTTTNVRVEAFGRDVFLFLNNTFDSMTTVSANRISGEASLYISDPWYAPAVADIGSIKMESISALSISGTSGIFNGRISKYSVYESTTVPPNFSLSFSIKPHENFSDWTNIIHYSGDQTDLGIRGRMPGTSFKNFFHRL
jgi:hypothetical protein